jgi:hypothetical protein
MPNELIAPEENDDNVVELDPSQFIENEQRRAVASAISSTDDDPAKAARAQELAQVSGAHPTLVYNNLENFERQQKVALTNQLLRNNQYLQQFLNDNPLGAKIANGDYGKLDAVTQKLHNYGFIGAPSSVANEAVQAAYKGWQRDEAFGTTAFRSPGGAEAWAQGGTARAGVIAMNLLGVPFELLDRATSAGLEGLRAGTEEAYKQFGGGEQGAKQFSRDITGVAENQLMGGGPHAGHLTPEAITNAAREMIDKQQAHKLMEYIKVGKEPPTGISPIYDQLKIMEAEKDLKNLDDIAKDPAAMKELSPDLYSNYITSHTDAQIGISAKKIGELYGDKTPTPDDGLLGWIPNLADRLALEKESGGFIEVPMSDWLAKADPDVAKELHDDVRVRRNGLSKNEIDTVKEASKPPEDPLKGPMPTLESGHGLTDTLRTALHAEPMFDGERAKKLKLERAEEEPDQGHLLGETGVHHFDIVDAEGKGVGRVSIVEREDGKKLHVGWVGSGTGAAPGVPNAFGPRVVLDLMSQLKREFPDAKKIGGLRVSGAREHAEEISIPLNAPSVTDLDRLAFQLNLLSSPTAVIPLSADLKSVPFVSHGIKFDSSLAQFRVGDAIDTIKPEQMVGSLPAALYQFFGNRLKELAGDVVVRVIPNSEFAKYNEANKIQAGGYYSPKDHEIVFPASSVDGSYGKIVGPHVLIHEAAHAATVRAMTLDPELRGHMTSLMDAADAYMSKTLPEQRKYHNYAFQNVNEFVAESWSKQDLQQTLSHVPLPEEVAQAIGMRGPERHTIWDAFRKIISDILERLIGRKPNETILDGLLHLGPRFEELHAQFPELREPGLEYLHKAREERPVQAEGRRPVPPEEAPLEAQKPVGERPVYKTPGTFGLTPRQSQLYQRLINERLQQDHEAALDRAVKEQTKTQSKEWKANTEVMRKEVEQDMYNRPDIAANEWFRTGTLFGQRGKTPRIDPAFLSPEQKAGLPGEYVRRGGINPDDIAGTFGYQSGKAMVDRMVMLNGMQKQMDSFGKNFINRLVEKETDRRMQEKYGDLAGNIYQEAKDQVLNETQLDIIHQDILALAAKANAQLPFDRPSVKQWIKDEFLKTPMREVDSDAFISNAGKLGTSAEIFDLEGKFGDALKEKQAQYMAAVKAQEAVRIEKKKDQFDKEAKRYRSRVHSGTAQEYTNWIHDILMRVGYRVDRTPEDLANSINHMNNKTLEQFVQNREDMLREVPVADFLLDPKFKKNFDDLSVDEFLGLNDSVKGLGKTGRAEKKLIKAGDARDLDEVFAQMYEQMQKFGSKNYDAAGKRWLGPLPSAPARVVRTFVAAHLQIESLVNRWDKGDPFGLFTQYITRDLIDSANKEAIMERDFSRKLRAIADNADLSRRIDNDVFMDPFSIERGEPTPIVMTRKNLRAVMQHLGNESNFDKLARGYLHDKDMPAGDNAVEMFKGRIRDWVHQNATKEDWDWVSKQGKIFAELKEEADKMYRRMTDIEPESLPLRPVQTMFGDYEGWYHPLDNHPLWKGSSKSLMGPDPLEEGGYFRATTSNRYTKKRTGAAYPLTLDLDMTPVRMKQMIHDISFREALVEASKVIYDKRFTNMITDFYGREHSELFVPWLMDIAGNAGYRSAAQSVAANALEHVRQNAIAVLIGLNPGTVMKHFPTAGINSFTEINPLVFLKNVKSLFSVREGVGESNWSFAMDNSAELQRRTRHYSETMGGAQDRVLGELGPIEALKKGQLPSYTSLRESVIKFGSTPVALSDLLSAVPTWLGAFETAMKDPGMTRGDAVYLADRAVRRAHGSTAVTSRPGIARAGGLSSYLASLYGFFSHIWNRQFELGWRMRESVGLVKEGEYAAAAKELPKQVAMLFSYVIFPAVIEELVTPLTTDDKSSWGKKASKALAFGLGSSWVGIREVVHAMLHLQDPQAGLMTTVLKTGTDMSRDLSKGAQAFDKQHVGMTIQHGITAFGAVTGLTNAQEGKAVRFIHDYATGVQKPRGWNDWYKGIRYGTMKERH